MGELELSGPRVLVTITCQGRALDGDGQPVGEICGTTYRPWGRINPLDGARAAGWRIGVRADGTPDAMCPRCARPDAGLVRMCRDLEAR